jgi:hypothetical protein
VLNEKHGCVSPSQNRVPALESECCSLLGDFGHMSFLQLGKELKTEGFGQCPHVRGQQDSP